ncbi:hypothetical protein Tco_0150193 [Tanacetum coccineum]
MASSACSSTQNPPRKLVKIDYIDLSSNETSPQPSQLNLNTTIDTTLALTIPPLTSNQTNPMVEPFATPLAPRSLVFSTPPNTPIEPHPFLFSTNDAPPRTTNPFPHSIFQDLPQTLQQTTPLEPTLPYLNTTTRTNTQPKEKERIQQEINNLQSFNQNVQEAIQNAQYVQDSLIPPTSITHVQLPPPFYPITASIQTPPFDPSFPPPSTFGPIDQTLWLEQPPKPQDHTCPHCQKTETIINNFQTETRFMLNRILERLNHILSKLPQANDH